MVLLSRNYASLERRVGVRGFPGVLASLVSAVHFCIFASVPKMDLECVGTQGTALWLAEIPGGAVMLVRNVDFQ